MPEDPHVLPMSEGLYCPVIYAGQGALLHTNQIIDVRGSANKAYTLDVVLTIVGEHVPGQTIQIMQLGDVPQGSVQNICDYLGHAEKILRAETHETYNRITNRAHEGIDHVVSDALKRVHFSISDFKLEQSTARISLPHPIQHGRKRAALKDKPVFLTDPGYVAVDMHHDNYNVCDSLRFSVIRITIGDAAQGRKKPSRFLARVGYSVAVPYGTCDLWGSPAENYVIVFGPSRARGVLTDYQGTSASVNDIIKQINIAPYTNAHAHFGQNVPFYMVMPNSQAILSHKVVDNDCTTGQFWINATHPFESNTITHIQIVPTRTHGFLFRYNRTPNKEDMEGRYLTDLVGERLRKRVGDLLTDMFAIIIAYLRDSEGTKRILHKQLPHSSETPQP
ncbi:hypothetical protein HY491_01165 [Candidatus Woesearchaeota archaeon]|nr:hypothetical protein [Candidatus Woesearchaeota archaeon]